MHHFLLNYFIFSIWETREEKILGVPLLGWNAFFSLERRKIYSRGTESHDKRKSILSL